MVSEGLSKEAAARRIFLIDIDGLIHYTSKHVSDAQRPYCQPREAFKNWKGDLEKISLLDVVKNVHPTILIGVSAQGGAFNKEIIEEISRHTDRPMIFPSQIPPQKRNAPLKRRSSGPMAKQSSVQAVHLIQWSLMEKHTSSVNAITSTFSQAWLSVQSLQRRQK